jgi:hypothetical protein
MTLVHVDELHGELAWLASNYQAEAMLLVDRLGRVARVRFEDVMDSDDELLARVQPADAAKVNAELQAYRRRRVWLAPPRGGLLH